MVDPPSVLTTHLTEVVRDNMAELLSYAETQKLLDELPREQQKLVADLIPSQITAGGVQRVLAEPAGASGCRSATWRRSWKASRKPAAAQPAPSRRSSRMFGRGWRGRSATATPAPGGYIPLITLSAEWETAFAEALSGPPEDRQLAMAPSKLQEFMQRLRAAFDDRSERRGGSGAADRQAASAAMCAPSSIASGRTPRCWRRPKSFLAPASARWGRSEDRCAADRSCHITHSP